MHILASLEIFFGPLGPIVILVIALLFFGHRIPHLFGHKKDAQQPSPPVDPAKLSAPDKQIANPPAPVQSPPQKK
ncbi:MAG TPA: hypothetical protein VKX17_18465 [Planctomycetota bacterium]|nr:hypothetical protein [Planctomycetota bacterium]